MFSPAGTVAFRLQDQNSGQGIGSGDPITPLLSEPGGHIFGLKLSFLMAVEAVDRYIAIDIRCREQFVFSAHCDCDILFCCVVSACSSDSNRCHSAAAFLSVLV